MQTEKINLVELNAQELQNIEGGNTFLDYCYSVYRTISNWAMVL